MSVHTGQRVLQAVSARIAARPRRAIIFCALITLVLVGTGLIFGGFWGIVAVALGVPAAGLGYALQLRRLWVSGSAS